MSSTASLVIASLEGATKAYGAHRVLDGFDFALQAGLTALARRRFDRLSDGEAQFAMVIAGSPDLLVLDEPTTGFDPESHRAMWDEVRAKANTGSVA